MKLKSLRKVAQEMHGWSITNCYRDPRKAPRREVCPLTGEPLRGRRLKLIVTSHPKQAWRASPMRKVPR